MTRLSRVSLTLSIFWKPIMSCQPEIHLSVLARAREDRECSDRETLTWKSRIEGGTHIYDTLSTRRDCFAEFNQKFIFAWFFGVISSLLICCLKWSYSAQAGSDLVMMFPGYDELLREDSRTNWRIWVWCSPQGESSSTELKMIWREITITQTLTRGRIMTEFI